VSPGRWAPCVDPELREGEAPSEPPVPPHGSDGASPSPGFVRPLLLVPQVAGSLDHRLEAALCRLLARGHERVCIIGSDSPTLPVSLVTDAFAALTTAEFVLVPAQDGGFVLLGARACPPRLLAGIDWSTDRVCDQARVRLERWGSVEVLDAAYDVDTLADLQRLAADPELERCPSTRAALRLFF
jgi:glycosyltransferase A (GT-A) superfamily protein (DUF2064 family)